MGNPCAISVGGDVKHVKGIVSMARGDDPNSGLTSFFVCTGTSTALDGQYSVFARVVDGLSVIESMESVPRNNEAPVTRIELKTMFTELLRRLPDLHLAGDPLPRRSSNFISGPESMPVAFTRT